MKWVTPHGVLMPRQVVRLQCTVSLHVGRLGRRLERPSFRDRSGHRNRASTPLSSAGLFSLVRNRKLVDITLLRVKRRYSRNYRRASVLPNTFLDFNYSSSTLIEPPLESFMSRCFATSERSTPSMVSGDIALCSSFVGWHTLPVIGFPIF
jgi:hypothetical protein